jgi:Family of unknown function (DUF5361)
MHGEAADWSTDTHLLALIADIGQIANWQRTENGTKGRGQPTPIPRPGVERASSGLSTEESIAATRAALLKHYEKPEVT